MVKVLIVEDEVIARAVLFRILSSDPEIEVIGQVENGKKALEFVKNQRPDIITMDINMPTMNGFEATKQIMSKYPTPIIICTASWNTQDTETSFLALEAGALALLAKPKGIGHPLYEKTKNDLIRTVKSMACVKVVTRKDQRTKSQSVSLQPQILEIPSTKIKIIGIGASTGGPIVLQSIFSNLPADFSVPIVIVQHIAEGFIEGFAGWLDNSCNLSVRVATDGEEIRKGHIYLSKDGYHISINKSGEIVYSEKNNQHICPSIDNLFYSLGKVYEKHAIGILLTGMGKDGADGLKTMKEKGAITIAQNEESSMIYGMPKEAIDIGAATQILNPDEIVKALIKFTNKGSS